MTTAINIDYIALDWGTSHLRAWAMTQDGRVLAQKQSDMGMSRLQADRFEPVLLSLVSDWLESTTGNAPPTTKIIACGMLGARQGWFEVPYRQTPCSAVFSDTSHAIIRAPTNNTHIDVYIVAGIKQTHPADVMRGEETQIAGYLCNHQDFDGVICLPGTHSKWVSVTERTIRHFQTSVTGELFALLRDYSLFQHSLGTWDMNAFTNAVASAYSQPDKILSHLFRIRADYLLGGNCEVIAKLSGTLIGIELAGTQVYWQNNNTVVIGNTQLTKSYCTAIESLGGRCTSISGDAMTIRGLFEAGKTSALV